MKKGFTLAEVLVTLGIIGVVAALTTPALIQNVGNAKIGPKLQKAKATWEVAAEMLLNEENANSLWGVTHDSEELGNKMSNFMKITRTKHSENGNFNYSTYDNTSIVGSTVETNPFMGLRFDSDDGMIYYISLLSRRQDVGEDLANIPNNQLIGYLSVDINGSKTPNVIGKDTFAFEIYNDGALRPVGGMNSMRHHTNRGIPTWKHAHDALGCNEQEVYAGWGCAG